MTKTETTDDVEQHGTHSIDACSCSSENAIVKTSLQSPAFPEWRAARTRGGGFRRAEDGGAASRARAGPRGSGRADQRFL